MNGCLLDKLHLSETWVIGNGESRKHFDLSRIKSHTIGCNAIHRDYVCDEIVAVDRRMVNEILLNPLYKTVPIYTRPNWIQEFKQHLNVKVVPNLPYSGVTRIDDPWHWGSGPFAVLLAAQNNFDTVNLLGFDLYGIDSKMNNVYKDTINYAGSDKHAIDFSYWVYQIAKVFEYYPQINFKIWNTGNWTMPKEWHSNNLTFCLMNV